MCNALNQPRPGRGGGGGPGVVSNCLTHAHAGCPLASCKLNARLTMADTDSSDHTMPVPAPHDHAQRPLSWDSLVDWAVRMHGESQETGDESSASKAATRGGEAGVPGE